MSEKKPELVGVLKHLPRLADDPDYARAAKVQAQAAALRGEKEAAVVRLGNALVTPTGKADISHVELAEQYMAGGTRSDASVRDELAGARKDRARAERAWEASRLACRDALDDFRRNLMMHVAPMQRARFVETRALLVELQARIEADAKWAEELESHVGTTPVGVFRTATFKPSWVECGLKSIDEELAEIDRIVAGAAPPSLLSRVIAAVKPKRATAGTWDSEE